MVKPQHRWNTDFEGLNLKAEAGYQIQNTRFGILDAEHQIRTVSQNRDRVAIPDWDRTGYYVYFVTRASVGEWGLSRTKVCSGAVGVLRVAISGSRQGIGRGRDLR